MEKKENRKGIIYSVTNKINLKMYIGQTICGLEHRKNSHFNDMKNKDYDYYFYRALRKYGKDKFDWEVLEENIEIENLNDKEIYYIKEYETFGKGYNSNAGGNCSSASEETKKKMSIKTKEMADKNREKYGKGCSPETSKKISLAKIGKKKTEETKKKMSVSKTGDKNSLYGKHYTEEEKEKISIRSRKIGTKSHNTSGFKGVCATGKNKWRASMTHNRKGLYLGSFDTKVEAAIAYDNKLIELHGEENVTTNKSLGLY